MQIIKGWLDEAVDGHYGVKSSPRNGAAPKYLVMHGTAGGVSAAAIDDYFTNGGVQASAHFIIDQQGVIIQGISCDMAAWANCCTSPGHAPYLADGETHNLETISIEHVKSSDDNSNTLTPIQAQKSFEVAQCICDTYGIPKRAGDAIGGIISHADIDPVNRSRCPGPYPWNELFDYLSGGSMKKYGTNSADFNQYLTDNGNGTWTGKKINATLRGGNLALYQTLSIDGNTLPVIGLPRTDELNQHDADGYAWTVQFFERGVIVYDPQHKKDSQPGMGASYLGQFEQFITLDPEYHPPTVTVEKIPDAVIVDIKQLRKDAGL